jgi:tetratricopeptide (TPR) repeat protein
MFSTHAVGGCGLSGKIRTLVFSIAALLLPFSARVHAQGFGKFKKTITLQRKLPAVAQLPGDTYAVSATASDARNKPLTDKLKAIVETELARYNAKLTVDSNKPDTRISLNILNVDVSQPIPITSTTIPLNYGKKGMTQPQQKPSGYKITGRFDVAYQAKTPAGRFVDASNLNIKFAQQYNTQGGKMDEGVDAVKKGFSRIRHLGKSSSDEQEEQAPHTVEDVEQIMMERVTARIAARLVTTNETVEIPLARGALDDANKYADAKQWSKMAEALETMTPLSDPRDDAYRFYNLGVAYEALGYSAETPAAARRDLEEAAADYGKAADMNPAERKFLEPQNRIEIALEHYKKLSVPTTAAPKSAAKKSSKSTSK